MSARLKDRTALVAGGSEAGWAGGTEHRVTPTTSLCARRTLFKAAVFKYNERY